MIVALWSAVVKTDKIARGEEIKLEGVQSQCPYVKIN